MLDGMAKAVAFVLFKLVMGVEAELVRDGVF
jgi:hypothetical protein